MDRTQAKNENGKKEVEEVKVKSSASQTGKKKTTKQWPKADRKWRTKNPAPSQGQVYGPESPRQIAFIKSMLVFVYQLYLNKAILKSDGGHEVNESKVPS